MWNRCFIIFGTTCHSSKMQKAFSFTRQLGIAEGLLMKSAISSWVLSVVALGMPFLPLSLTGQQSRMVWRSLSLKLGLVFFQCDFFLLITKFLLLQHLLLFIFMMFILFHLCADHASGARAICFTPIHPEGWVWKIDVCWDADVSESHFASPHCNTQGPFQMVNESVF